MQTVRSFRMLFGLGVLLGCVAGVAATPPPGYLEKSAHEKMNFHRDQARATQYTLRTQPGFIRTACNNTVGALGLFSGIVSSRFIRQSLDTPSGYPDTLLRKLFGKPVHSQGVTASGEVVFAEKFLEFEPGVAVPVTYRFSRANLHIPGIPGAEHRPGLLVIFHRDGKEDLNLFLMPEDGLTGYRQERNPFSLVYTHWLNTPSAFTNFIGGLTFGAAAADFLTQFSQALGHNISVSDSERPTRQNSPQLLFNPDGTWLPRYDVTDKSLDWRQRFERIPMGAEPARLFVVSALQEGKFRVFAQANLLSPWISNQHGDTWFARHTGFIEK